MDNRFLGFMNELQADCQSIFPRLYGNYWAIKNITKYSPDKDKICFIFTMKNTKKASFLGFPCTQLQFSFWSYNNEPFKCDDMSITLKIEDDNEVKKFYKTVDKFVQQYEMEKSVVADGTIDFLSKNSFTGFEIVTKNTKVELYCSWLFKKFDVKKFKNNSSENEMDLLVEFFSSYSNVAEFFNKLLKSKKIAELLKTFSLDSVLLSCFQVDFDKINTDWLIKRPEQLEAFFTSNAKILKEYLIDDYANSTEKGVCEYYLSEEDDDSDDDEIDEEDFDDEESKTTGKTKKRRNRTPKSPTFEGLLYDDYGIKRDMLVNDAITILKNEGWQIVENDDVEPNITTLVPSGETTLYGLPLSGIALAECYLPPENFRSPKEEENEGKLAGIVCYFPQSVEKKLSNFMEKEFIQRYGLKRKDNDEIGLPVYAKLQEEKFLGLDISSEIDYARALVIDNSFSDYVLVYSFFSESRYANPFFSTLRKEWSDTLVQQTDDDAKMMYNYKTVGASEFYDETPNEEFTKLLDKWEDILQRDDIKIDVRNPKDRYSGTDASMIHTYKTILEYYSPQKDARLNLEFGRNSSRECFLHLYYSKGKHQIEGGVSMRYEYSTSLTDFAIKAKLCLDSLLAHIGRTDLAKLVAKFQAKKDAEDAERKRKEEELEKQKWEQEWEQEQREQDEFEDDFDNL